MSDAAADAGRVPEPNVVAEALAITPEVRRQVRRLAWIYLLAAVAELAGRALGRPLTILQIERAKWSAPALPISRAIAPTKLERCTCERFIRSIA